MKTLKELMEDLQNDQAFAAKFTEAVNAKAQEGADEEPSGAISEVAAAFGYEVDPEEVKKLTADYKENLSEEELGKVAGGTAVFMWAFTALSVVFISAAASEAIRDDM